MKVEFDAEDSARLPADVPNDVFTVIGQKPQRMRVWITHH
jgi:hypothetical protein